MLRKLSLKYRIAATIFILEAVAMTALLSHTLVLSVRAIEARQAAHEEVTLRALSNMARIALLTEEYAELQPYIEQIPDDKDVKAILLADANGKVVASTRMRDVGLRLPDLPAHADRVWRVQEISNASGLIGRLAIEFSVAEMQKTMVQARNRGILIALISMVAIAVVGIAIGFLLTRRLEALTHAAQRMARGQFDTNTDLRGGDEVADVSRAFDKMARSIQSYVADLNESKERFALAVSGTNDGIWDWDVANDRLYCSPRLKQILGYPLDSGDTTIATWKAAVHPDEGEQTIALLDEYLDSDNDFFESEHRLRKQNGDYIWASIRARASRDAHGVPVRMAGSLTDITARKQQETTIQHQALHDALTALPNRALLDDRLRQAVLLGRRSKTPVAVFMIDVDRFKEINDTLGHNVGDYVLKQLAQRFQNALRGSDTISRFGGDEFVIVLPGVDAITALTVVQKLVNALEPAMVIDGNTLRIEASIGVAVFPDHGADAQVLIQHADIAMYTAKRAHLGFCVYDSSQNKNSSRRLTLTGDMRDALANDEFVLHYQPKIDAASGKIYGVEALVRWQHPLHGMLYPDTFIPLAEQCGLIHGVTLWVIDKAIEQLRAWHAQGRELSISVNLSTRNLQDEQLPERLAQKLQAANLAPRYLELEITESAIMADPVRALRVLSALNALGVRLSLDDFGTGYSSLAYLSRLPIQAVKIDKSFVIGMETNDSNAKIVRTIIDLGHHLGREVIAEGVENKNVFYLLKEWGCDAVQGYWIGRPEPNHVFLRWLQESPFASGTAARKPALKIAKRLVD